MNTKRLMAFLVIINMTLTISINNILFAYNEPIIIDPLSGERIYYEIPGYGYEANNIPYLSPYGSYYTGYGYSGYGVSPPQYTYNGFQPYSVGYQQPFNPYGYGYQQPYNPYNYQQPFNPKGYPWSNPVYQPYQNYAMGQPTYNWQAGPSSYYPTNYGYVPPNYNYGWSPMSSPFFNIPPYSLLTTSFTDTSGNQISDESIDDEEYAVISALIEEEYASSTILILNYSRDWEEEEFNYDNLIEDFDDLEDETVEDFIDKNEESYYFEENFTLDEDYILVNKNQQMYNVLKISRVGLNSDEDQAIVYLEYVWASLGGQGYYFYLVKEDGDWKVKDKVLVMMA